MRRNTGLHHQIKEEQALFREIVSVNAGLLLYFCLTGDSNKGNSLSEQSFRCYAQSLLCIEREVHEVRIFKDTCRDKWLGWLVRAWKEKNLKIRGKKVQGKGMLIALFKWALRVRVFVFLFNPHQKASTKEGALNNQEDRISWPVVLTWISWVLSLPTPEQT